MEPEESEIGKKYASLTPHPEGSVREIWHVALPLMISFLSGSLMMFLDRLILATYSTAAMNAAAAAGMFCAIFHFGAIGITSIAEVFVGQSNGAKKYREVGAPVWQMLWFSLATALLFVPLAFTAGPLLLPEYHFHDLGLPYFQWMMLFGPVFPAVASLTAFFVGLGKVRLVLVGTIIANVINVGLDILLIFGVGNFLPPMGTTGAAIATGISQCVQLGIFAAVFFNWHNRAKYGTALYRFRPSLLWSCLKIGTPNALSHIIEIAAWATTTRMIASLSEAHLSMAVIGQSFYMLIAFGMEGLQKAVIAVTANFIGAKRWEMVAKAWRSAIKLLLISAIPFSLILIVYPDPLIQLFISEETAPELALHLTTLLRFACAWIWLYFILDGLTWITIGVLTAAGDTFFIMVMNAFTAWTFAVLPIYLFVVKVNGPPTRYWMCICLYGFMNALSFYLRFRTAPWKKFQLPT